MYSGLLSVIDLRNSTYVLLSVNKFEYINSYKLKLAIKKPTSAFGLASVIGLERAAQAPSVSAILLTLPAYSTTPCVKRMPAAFVARATL